MELSQTGKRRNKSALIYCVMIWAFLVLLPFAVLAQDLQEGNEPSFMELIHPEYVLPWDVEGQKLIYRSQGCADMCWRAGILDTTHIPHRPIMTIMCDGQDLNVEFPPYGEKTSQPKIYEKDACQNLLENRNDYIIQTMKKLMLPPK